MNPIVQNSHTAEQLISLKIHKPFYFFIDCVNHLQTITASNIIQCNASYLHCFDLELSSHISKQIRIIRVESKLNQFLIFTEAKI